MISGGEGGDEKDGRGNVLEIDKARNRAAQLQPVVLTDEAYFRQNHKLKRVDLQIYDVYEVEPDDQAINVHDKGKASQFNQALLPHVHTPLRINMQIVGQIPDHLTKTIVLLMFCSGCQLVYFVGPQEVL